MTMRWHSDKDRQAVNDAPGPRGGGARLGLALCVFLVGFAVSEFQEGISMAATLSSPLTLDCGDAPNRLCSALVEALAAARPDYEIQMSKCPGPGPHMRLDMSRIAANGLTGRLVLREPGGAVQVTPFLSVRVMDHPRGLPESVWADFARGLLRIGYSKEE